MVKLKLSGTFVNFKFLSSFQYRQKRFVSSRALTRTEIKIPVPITGGHLAAQLWETPSVSTTSTPIICMHGYQDNSSSFDPLIPLIIKDGMTIISVDQPGHGLSSHLAGTTTDVILDGVGTIHRVIRHFGWNKVILLGHSFGSVLSFVFTATNADLVEKYIAIENLLVFQRYSDNNVPLIVNTKIRNLFSIETKLTDRNKMQKSYTFDEIVKRTFKARNGTVTEEGIKTLLSRGAQSDPKNPNLLQFTNDLKTNITSYTRFSEDEPLQFAKNIRCPVCVIKADPGEDYEPRESFMKTVEEVKKANGGKLTFHLVPGTHHLHLNEPTCVAPLITNFLENS